MRILIKYRDGMQTEFWYRRITWGELCTLWKIIKQNLWREDKWPM